MASTLMPPPTPHEETGPVADAADSLLGRRCNSVASTPRPLALLALEACRANGVQTPPHPARRAPRRGPAHAPTETPALPMSQCCAHSLAMKLALPSTDAG